MYLARKHTGAAYSEIGRYFGGRNHSTVISAEKKVAGWLRDEQRQLALARLRDGRRPPGRPRTQPGELTRRSADRDRPKSGIDDRSTLARAGRSHTSSMRQRGSSISPTRPRGSSASPTRQRGSPQILAAKGEDPRWRVGLVSEPLTGGVPLERSTSDQAFWDDPRGSVALGPGPVSSSGIPSDSRAFPPRSPMQTDRPGRRPTTPIRGTFRRKIENSLFSMPTRLTAKNTRTDQSG